MIIMWTIIIISLLFLFYTYFGYPLLIYFLSRLTKQKSKIIKSAKDYNPPITVILTVYNEEENIINKLDNLSKLEYPQDKLNIVIVDDGSTDNTFSLIEKYIKDNDRINIKPISQENKGKAVSINTACDYIKDNFNNNDERLIFLCDSRQRIEEKALSYMVSSLKNDDIAYVSGIILIPDKKGPGIYWKYEQFIRDCESKFHSVTGGSGQIALVRFNLIPKLPANLILDDVYIPMKCILNGKKVIFENKAKAYDIEYHINKELQRKYRTLTGNFQILKYLPEILSFRKNPIAFQYWSHKIFRLIAPYFLIILFITSFTLFLAGSVMGGILFFLQILFYTYALIGRDWNIPLLTAIPTFVNMNFAAIVGLIRFIRKDYRWTSAKSRK
ncbi:MAG: glycosyltransferase [Spirochaetota bacterium]